MQAVQDLTWLQERAFDLAYDCRKRKMWLTYLLAVPLGGFGAHRFYLGRVRSASLMFSLCAAGAALAMALGAHAGAASGVNWSFSLGAILMASVWSWALADLFCIPALVSAANEQIEADLRVRIRAGLQV